MMQTDLFNQVPQPSYPYRAGHSEPTTSRDAAIAIEGSGKASNDRALLLAWFRKGNRGTADDAIKAVGLEPVLPRPRVTELGNQGLLVRTGVKRKAFGGRLAHEWRAA